MRIRNQGISESTLQLQWAWWRPCWSELWDFPGTKIFRRSFRKDDGPNTPITRPLMMVKEPIRMITVLQGEFHGNTETYLNHQFSRRFWREFVCLKLEIPMRNPAAFTNCQVSYQGEDTIPVGIPRCSEPDPPGPARSLLKTLRAEVGFCDVTIFRPIRTTNRICITTRWILSAIHLAKWHAPTKKMMRVQGVF